MANPKWGNKRTCFGCGKQFYDMRREPIICPGCDAPFEFSPPGRVRRQRATVEPQTAAPAEPPPKSNAEAEGESADLAAGADETAGTEDIADVEEKDADLRGCRVLQTTKNRFGGCGHTFFLALNKRGFKEVARVSAA